MTTITREQQKQILIDTANHVISRDNTSPYSENLRELARIALASLEAEKGADPVVFTDERNLHHIARGRETSLIWGKQNQEVGDIPLYRHAQPVPVVPDDISGIIERFQYQADHLSEWHHIDEHSCKVNRRDLMTALEFMDSCRAAMLQGVEPVSNHDELALYYLQGQKDGLEWAAQLAEANPHLQATGFTMTRWSWLKLSEKVQICPSSLEALQ
ncbi:Phage EaA protein [Salmonella enterica subsp. enterica serovar Agona str. 632182-2]|nr:Phage EaA protein [Salmonella enterica subsp. enterica serovar Agona str. 632182-2]